MLDPRYISTNRTEATYQPQTVGGLGWEPRKQLTEAYDTTTYSGPGGQWTKNKQGGWTNASGTSVGDLAGFLKKQQQIASGSDFSGYQNQLSDLLKQQSKANQRYQELLNDPNKIKESAGYKYALGQGNQAINRSAAAKGMLNSGNVLAELAKYGQGMASQNYQQQIGNYQQDLQNQNTLASMMANLAQNAQNFGLQSGYFDAPTPDNQRNIAGLNKPSWGNF